MGNMTGSETRELAGIIGVLALTMIALGISIIPYTVKRMTAAYKLESGKRLWGTVLRTLMIIITLTSVVLAFVRVSVELEAYKTQPLFPMIVVWSIIGILSIACIIICFMILKSRNSSQVMAEGWKFIEPYNWFGIVILLVLSIWNEVFALVSVTGTALGTRVADATTWNFNSGRFLLRDGIAFFCVGIVLFGITYIFAVVVRNLLEKDGS